jgi:tRNA A37 threonylcarbamoyltransferase TsaD
VPLLKFPFVTVLATGKHTEIVLNRGVGLHTVLGISIDCGCGEVLDKAYNNLMRYNKVLQDED